MAVLVHRLGHRVGEGRDGRDRVHDLVRKHADQLGPGVLLVLLALHLEDSPDAVQRPVELVTLLEAEVQLAVLQRVHHVRHLLDILPPRAHCR
ncbi:MAG: hypothetical protein K6A62_02245 [Bacteroidales bacterium]|nr:hypothetical protein [Bacteroidales bacterium]